VLAVFPDLYGRLIGKRIAGPFFFDQVVHHGMHACDYLLTVDMVVRGEPKRGSSKSDALGAYGLAECLRTGRIGTPVYKAPRAFAKLREQAQLYWAVTQDLTRAKNRLKSSFRRRGVRCEGTGVYGEQRRAQLLRQLPAAMREAVRVLGEQVDYLEALKAEVESALVEESHRHAISRILEKVPGLGPVRVAQLLPIVVTPHRFRTKRPFWAYCGFAIVTHSSADWVEESRMGGGASEFVPAASKKVRGEVLSSGVSGPVQVPIPFRRAQDRVRRRSGVHRPSL
jgi:hypothetical protein